MWLNYVHNRRGSRCRDVCLNLEIMKNDSSEESECPTVVMDQSEYVASLAVKELGIRNNIEYIHNVVMVIAMQTNKSLFGWPNQS